ncbi:MAG: nucleoside recognition domain-containing protein [Desulfobulbaceae bacterium]|nr:nucleoside recognition domain-containing protein [Desulfobulbaceae bacterium]MDY0350138.1 nucleoside recognition domain-containing protein [Desulfobulbaceae bacterium]
MLNIIWIGFFLGAAATALFQIFFLDNPGVLNAIMDATFSMSVTAFEIALGLTGVMTLWLGLMRIGQAGGAIALLTRLISPFLVRLFPEVPRNHPAQGAMVMNLAANMLGLDNAATPLGLKAMNELQELNPQKDTASNAQIMFLVINTSSVTLIPVTIFTYLYQLGYANPTELFLPILLATSCSSLAGLTAVSLYQRINLLQPVILLYFLGFFTLVALLFTSLLSLDKAAMHSFSMQLSNGIIFGVIILFILLAALKKVNVYEEFISGAREGFKVAVAIIPYLVAMLVAIGVFRASGAMDLLLGLIDWVFRLSARLLDWVGLITYGGGPLTFIDALPTGLMKPLSGSGARGVMIETIKTYGPDALVSKMAAVMQGSTETTFYVLALYFGSVGIRKSRHAITCGLIADGAGITAAILICYFFFT